MTKAVGEKTNSECKVERFTQTRRSAFTLIELLVVIAIIGLLAGLVVGLSSHAARSSRISRIRAELRQLETAIEAYKAKFGYYPPDNIVSQPPATPYIIVNPVTNQLFYELTGTIIDGLGFRIPNRDQIIGTDTVKQFFGAEGFVHSSKNLKDIKPFISLKSSQYAAINSGPDVEVLVVPVPWPLNNLNFPPPIATGAKQVNPWRYVATNPTNNPGGFDLWAEFVDGKKVKIICNWSKDILEKP
jgi:prepilin-type N-terminal cleavage/methylation domain-containing protein